MSFETTLTVPTRHLPELTLRLKRAGFTVLDTGDRIATDAGLDAEATIRLLHLTHVEYDPEGHFELGVSA